MERLISLNNIEHRQGAFCLSIKELTLRAGRIYALTGPNGAGKSTLLRLLALLEAPQTGEVSFAGEGVRNESARQQRRRQITLVHQSPYLFTGSVRDNLAFGLRLRGYDRSEQEAGITEALAAVGLSGCESRPVRELSGGEAQRVALARALALRPQLLLLDEPSAGLDCNQLPALEEWLLSRSRRGMAVVIASHDPGQIQRLDAEEIRLRAGTIDLRERASLHSPHPKEYSQWRQHLQRQEA